nr:SGNH/GDSL hydrolase family protein [uncultured Clostridium sp.]
MIVYGIEFHNVDHLEEVEGMGGKKLCRFPRNISRSLGVAENRNARFRADRVHGCELRFVTESKYFDVALTAVEQDIDVLIYKGDLFHRREVLKAGVCTVLHVEDPPVYEIVNQKMLTGKQFAPWIWRIQFGMNGAIYFHYIDTYENALRPPKREEKPEVLWAAYGSSITCGSVTNLYSNSYINQAAVKAGWDVMNKGLSGSCLCEVEVADYLAELSADVLSLEIGVNMVLFFEEEETSKRVRYLLETLKKSPAGDIFVIDMFPNKGLIALDQDSAYYRHYRSFKEIVRQAASTVGDQRFHLIKGEDVLVDFTYLSTDLLHPSDNGHIRMGANLADQLTGKRKRSFEV